MDVDLMALAVCAWLLTYALHSSLMIAVAWLSSACLDRIGSLRSSLGVVRERLWKLALLGGIATATVQTALGGGPWGLAAESGAAEPVVPVESVITLPASTNDVPSATPVFVDPVSFSRSLRAIQLASGPASTRSIAPATPAVGVALEAMKIRESAPARTIVLPPLWIRTILGVWIAGVLLGFARWGLDRRRLAAALRGRKYITHGPAREVLDALVKRTGVGSRVRLVRAPCITAPITIGFLRPAICLPPRAESELQRDELEALLAHELAHALRRDPAWLCACRAIEVMLFFQPLNRLARIRLADEAEYLCDDWAVRHTRERLSLASCLTEIAGWIVGRERELKAPAMAARGSRLELRVRRVLDGGDGRDGFAVSEGSDGEGRAEARAPRWMSPLACGAVGAVVLFVPGISARGGGLAESDVLAGNDTLSEPAGRLAIGSFADLRAAAPEEEDGADDPLESPESDDGVDGVKEATLIDLGVQAMLAGVLTVGNAQPTPACAVSAAEASAEQPSPPARSTAEATFTVAGATGTNPVIGPTGTAGSSETRSSPASMFSFSSNATPAPAIAPPAPTVGADAWANATGVDVAGAPSDAGTLNDARAFSADIAELEQTLEALKSELTQRQAPSEFKRRMKNLEAQLRTLQKQRTQLVLYMNTPSLRVAAPHAARPDDHLTTQDRK